MKPNQLKVERTVRGWSQARVAEAVGTNVRTVIRWEQGQTIPHPYYQEQLCALFNKNARELGWLADENTDAAREPDAQHAALTPSRSQLFDPTIPMTLGSRMIGREQVLAQLKRQLWEGCDQRTIALQGLPGMGKTSLAVALTSDQVMRELFCDGILWAGLGQEPDVLGQLVRWGKLLGVAPGEVENVNSCKSWSRALQTAIGSHRLLLVIDDAWNVEDALAFQVGGSHCAHVLTTRLPIVAFAFAREGTQVIPELQETDGLSLLARFVPHLVRQDAGSAQALARAVGGSPLALTLMGSYLAAQAFTGQTRRLRYALSQLHNAEQRMRLSVPVAQAERSPCLPEDTPLSLYAAIAVSVHHLSAQEHDALCALAAFPPKPNSFSEEATLAVSAATVETLDALWDAGLLESSGSDRYTLHQTIVDYAATRCHDAKNQQRLFHYILWYIQEHERDYEALEREQGNILAALDSAATLDAPHELLQGVLALTSFMRVRGHYALAHRLLSQAQQVAIQQKDAMGHMHILRHLAAFAELRGDYAQAERYSREGLDLAQQLGSPRNSESSLLTTLGLVSFHRGDYEQAKNRFEEGLRLARNFGNDERTCILLTHLGRVLHFQGDYHRAEALYQEGLTLAQASEQHELLNRLLIYIGGVNLSQGNNLQAQRYYEEGLVLARSLGHREHLEALLNDMGILAYNNGLARVVALQGEIAEALHLAQESEAHFVALGHHMAATVREWWQGLCQPITLLPSLLQQ